MRKLARSRTNAVFAGVMGGFGAYFRIDATLLRVVFLFFVLVTGFFPGMLAYIFAMFLMPLEGESVIHTMHDEKR